MLEWTKWEQLNISISHADPNSEPLTAYEEIYYKANRETDGHIKEGKGERKSLTVDLKLSQSPPANTSLSKTFHKATIEGINGIILFYIRSYKKVFFFFYFMYFSM